MREIAQWACDVTESGVPASEGEQLLMAQPLRHLAVEVSDESDPDTGDEPARAADHR